MPSGQIRNFKRGQYLMHQNEKSRTMFIIKSGHVRVVRSDGPYIVYHNDMGAGSVVGELALIDGKPRSASVLALDDVEASLVHGEELDEIHKKLPPWLVALARSIVTRIRAVDDVMERNPNTYFKTSVNSLLVYLCYNQNGDRVFEKSDLIKSIQEITRVPGKKIDDYLNQLTSESYLGQDGSKIIIDHLEALESLVKKNQTPKAMNPLNL